jgi:hypothetical protein
MTDVRRRTQRFAARIPVTARTPLHKAKGRTINVSRYGARIELDLDIRKGENLWLALVLPLGVHIEVTAAVRQGKEDPEGIGVEFLLMPSHTLRHWEQFISGLEEYEAHVIVGSELPDRRVYPRIEASLMVWVPLEEGPQQGLTRDISGGGLFVRVPGLLIAGTEIELVVVQPDTEWGFPLLARVLRCGEPDAEGMHGVALKFVDMTPERERELIEFVKGT